MHPDASSISLRVFRNFVAPRGSGMQRTGRIELEIDLPRLSPSTQADFDSLESLNWSFVSDRWKRAGSGALSV